MKQYCLSKMTTLLQWVENSFRSVAKFIILQMPKMLSSKCCLGYRCLDVVAGMRALIVKIERILPTDYYAHRNNEDIIQGLDNGAMITLNHFRWLL